MVEDVALIVRNFIIEKFQRSSTICGISACLINYALNKLKVKNLICTNTQHAFVISGDSIVDVTVDQFEKTYGEICIIDKSHCKKKYFWKSLIKFDGYEEFALWQEKSGWPSNQILFNYENMLEEFDEYFNKNFKNKRTKKTRKSN